MEWSPTEFWRATFHDFTSAVQARRDATAPKRRDMTGADVAAMLSARAKG